jgi:hypothetical protein
MGPFGRTETMENAWVLSWISHQVVANPSELFSAGVFYPLPRALTFSEHLTVPGLIALPLLRITDDLVLTYNLILFFAIFSSALAMYSLAVSLTGNPTSALLAGLFYAFIPYRFDQLHLLQLQLYLFLPLMMACLLRFLRSGNRRWTWGIGGFFVLQYLSGFYLAVMAAASMSISLATLVPGASRPRREIVTLITVIVLAVVLVLPFTLPYLETQRTFGPDWDLDSIETVSAGVGSYLVSSSLLYRSLGRLWLDGDPTDRLFPGVTLFTLGAFGFGILLARRGGFARPWSTVSCYSLILLAGVVLSLGPKTPIYVLLHEHIVYFRGLRNVSWFGLLLFFSLSVFSSFALTWLFDRLGSESRRNKVAVAIGFFFLIESARVPLECKPLHDAPPAAYAWLADQARAGTIVELPYQSRQAERLFHARHHAFRPSLGGAGLHAPISHQWMEVLLRRFPSADSVYLLMSLDVKYIVIHLDSYAPRDLLRLLNDLARDRHTVYPVRDFGNTLIFGLAPELSSPPGGSGRSLVEKVLPSEILEQDSRDTASHTSEHELRLDSKSLISTLRLHYGPRPRAPAVRIQLQVIDDDTVGESVRVTPPDWPALTELIMGLLENPQDGTQVFRFAPIEAERLRIRLEGSGTSPEISRIEILGSPNPN